MDDDMIVDQEDVCVDDGYEVYEVAGPSRAYLAPKKRLNLEGRLLPVSSNSARTIEADNDRLRAENAQLREALARSGNRYLLADANDWMTRVRKLEMMVANLRGKVKETETEKRMEIQEMETEHRMEMLEVSHERDFYKAKYERLCELSESSRSGSQRDPKTGRFKNANDVSKDEQKKKALEMYERHISIAKIADYLGLATDTVKTYIRQEADSRAHQKALENFELAKQRQRAI